MILREVLKKTEDALKDKGIDDARLEAELIIRGALGIDKVEFITSDGRELTTEETSEIENRLNRRLAGEPAAYILGTKEFFGRVFEVNDDVLIPRPETEIMVEDVLEEFKGKNVKLLDIGTGSGAIAVTVALEKPSCEVTALDISEKALEVAKRNAAKLRANVRFIQSDLTKNVTEKFDGVMANLPYVPTKDIPDTHEPVLALDGGEDGLDTIRRLLPELPHILNEGAVIWLEIAINQYPIAEKACREVFPNANISSIKDLAGIDRFVKISIPR